MGGREWHVIGMWSCQVLFRASSSWVWRCAECLHPCELPDAICAGLVCMWLACLPVLHARRVTCSGPPLMCQAARRTVFHLCALTTPVPDALCQTHHSPDHPCARRTVFHLISAPDPQLLDPHV